MNATPRYWFRAKRNGWGWGLPLVWEGWVALAIWISAVIFGLVRMHDGSQARLFGFVAFMSAILVGLCWSTGEPPGGGRRGGT
jgi:hypothetical protein